MPLPPAVALAALLPEGQSHALLIRINDYQAGIPALHNSLGDVESVARMLAEKHGYQYP